MRTQRVVMAPAATRALRRVPRHIREKLELWVESVEAQGIAAVRRTPGFHDEPLRGARAGQRSIRLSRAYRAIYTTPEPTLVRVEEVSKHGY